MDIRLRFPLRRTFHVHDHWQLDANDAELTFETKGTEVTAFIVTYREQPIEMAPHFVEAKGEALPQINIAGSIEARARQLIQKFVDYANLYFIFDVDTDVVEAEYIPKNEAERLKIDVFKFRSSKERQTSFLPFDLLSQAFVAAESPDDPSFVARMLNLARSESLSGHYIDGFRYAFLFLEALYGNGKFRSRDLVRAFVGNHDLEQAVTQLIASALHERDEVLSPARSLAALFPSSEALIEHLVERRGFYFHGNLRHTASWHPARQKEAEPLAQFCVQLVGLVSQKHAGAMFSAEINTRLFQNAKKHGAIMTIQVQYEFIDQHNVTRKRVLNMSAAGTKPTSPLAIQAHKAFLEWAELNLGNEILVSAAGVDKVSGARIFQSRYLSSTSQSK